MRRLACLFALLAGCAGSGDGPATVEIFRPGTLFSYAPVTIRLDGRILGSLGPGQRMVCAIPGGRGVLTAEDETGSRDSLRLGGGTALVQVDRAIAGASLGVEGIDIGTVVTLGYFDRSDRGNSAAARASARGLVDCRA